MATGICKRPFVNDDLSTGDLAKLLGIAPRTVVKMLERGDLPCWRVPGDGTYGEHRRVARADAVAYLRRSGCRAALAALSTQVILCGLPEGLAALVPIPDPGQVLRVSSLVEAALAIDYLAGRHVIVLDASLGKSGVLASGLLLRAKLPQALLVGIASEDEPLSLEWAEWGFNASLISPVDPLVLARVVTEGVIAGLPPKGSAS